MRVFTFRLYSSTGSAAGQLVRAFSVVAETEEVAFDEAFASFPNLCNECDWFAWRSRMVNRPANTEAR